MVFEVVVLAKLVINEIEAQNAILEIVSLVHFGTLVTAASQDGVDKEDWDARNDENRMLEKVYNQIDVKARSTWIVDAKDKFFIPLIFFLLDKDNGCAQQSSFEYPLANSPGSHTLVSAGLSKDAVAKQPVDNIKQAQSTSDTLHLGVESKVD